MDENKNTKNDLILEDLKKKIFDLEAELKRARKILFEISGEKVQQTVKTVQSGIDGVVVEGVFDGENMIDSGGKVYPVPANYASKSKLVEGDGLKLTIANDGSFVFKQIRPIERRKVVGELLFENNAYFVESEGKKYNVLYASVTYYKGQNGDKVTIIIPQSGSSNWATLENIIQKEDETAAFFEEKESAPQSISITDEIEGIEIKKAENKPENLKSNFSDSGAVNNTIVGSVGGAPDSSVASSFEDKIKVDDIEISSPIKDKAPNAVDPGKFVNAPSVKKYSEIGTQNQPQVSSQPISEMEI